MRKFLFAIAAALLAVSIAAPAQAIDFKMTGLFWMEGVSADDADRNSRTHDGKQFARFLMRPRFHAIAEGGKVWAIAEIDIAGAGFRLVGVSVGRGDTQSNRHVVDFLIPGTQLRFRFGKSDWIGPSKSMMGSFVGLTRGQGYGLYGKLTNKLSIWAHDFQYNEDIGSTLGFQSPGRNTGVRATDGDVYHVRLTYKVSPNLAVTPFVYWDSKRGAKFDATDPDFQIYWYGLHLKGKAGILSYETMWMIQDGEIQFSNALKGIRQDMDVEAWGGFLDVNLNFGKLQLGGRIHLTSGDDDDVDATAAGANKNGMTQQQKNNKLERFTTIRQGASGWAIGPQLITERRFNTIPVYSAPSRQGTGNGAAAGNGLQFYEVRAKYALTKKIKLTGWVSVIRSDAQRADIDANNDGDTSDAGDTQYVSDKDIGTELDFRADWKMYKNLTMTGAVAYLFAGDYGQIKSSGGVTTKARALDDTWALYLMIRYTF